MCRTESTALGGVLFTSADVCDFRTHRPRMRVDDLAAPSRRFVARVSASVTNVDISPGRGGASPAADNDFASAFSVYTTVSEGSAEAPDATSSVAQPSPSRSLVQTTDSVEPAGPVASVANSRGYLAFQTMTQSSDHISTRTCRRSATAAGKARSDVDYGSGLGGAPRSSSRRITHRETHVRGRICPPP